MCSASFSADEVTLTASGGLDVWQGACAGQTGATCTVELVANRVVGARFLMFDIPPAPGDSLRDDLGDIARGRSQDFAQIAYNTPRTLERHELAEIELLLSPEQSVRELKRKLTAAGMQNGARVGYSKRMLARVAGKDFKIAPITEAIQGVSRAKETRWLWQIVPQKEGTLHLRLTLSMLIRVDGEPTPFLVDSYRATLEIRVSPLQRIEDFVEDNWQWLWTAILIPCVAWLVSKRRDPKKAEPAKDGGGGPGG